MTKKKTAKKKGATPAKRAYKKRATKVDEGGGEPHRAPVASHKKFETEDGIELLAVEKFEGISTKSSFRFTPEYQKLVHILRHLKPKEGFIIRDDWKNWPHRMVEELQLPIKISITKVVGNDAVKRVVRLS